MKSKIFLLFLLFAFYHTHAQQNFINVPSGEVTKSKKLFFQQQVNFNEIIQSNTTIDYGLGRNYEVGINVLGVNYVEDTHSLFLNDTNDRDPYNPLLTINGLKQIPLSENLALAVGAQAGINFDFDHRTRFASLAYVNLRLTDFLIKKSVFVAGPYYNSEHYGGAGNRLGGWLGTEFPMTDHLHFMAESVLGNNAISYTSLGIIYYPIKRMPLTLGVQIPNTKANAYAVVFELTITP